MRPVRLALTAALAAATAFTTAPAGGAQDDGTQTSAVRTVYVAPDGHDTNPGTKDQPFRTIERARDSVRDLIADGMSSDVVVVLRAGTYYQDEPLRLDERDSGRDGHQVVYTSEQGERPVVVGGRPITGWEPVDGEVYRALVPDLHGDWTFNQLFVNDERATFAREPDTGYYRTGAPGQGVPQDDRRGMFRYTQAQADVVENIADPSSVQVYMWGNDWFSNTVTVSGIDPGVRTVTLSEDVLQPIGNGNRYFVQGFAEALDQPGEWYLDREQSYIYYWPADTSVPIEQQAIVAPTVQDVFDVRGSSPDQRVHDVVIEELAFDGSAFTDYFMETQEASREGNIRDRGRVWNRPAKRNRHGVIRLENTANTVVRNLEIKNAGFSGISIDEYSRNVTVTGNEIHDFGYHGAIVTGVRAGVLDDDGQQVYDNHDHTITDNHIHHGGILVGHGAGVFLNQSGDNLLAHNRIHDMPRYGICVKGLISTEMADHLAEGYDGPEITWENHFDLLTSNNNVIAFNDISGVLQDSVDAGAISFKGIGKGTVVENNHIHDYAGRAHPKGIYLDDGSSFTLVKKNLVHGFTNTGNANVSHIAAKGYGNHITNNIFVLEEPSSIAITSAQSHNEPIESHQWDHNIYYAADHRAWPYRIRGGPWFPEWVDEADHNLVYSGTGGYRVTGLPGQENTWEHWKTLAGGRYEQNSLIADPLFVDPQNDDYRLRLDSPAFDLGIEPIDASTVGPRANPSDARLTLTAPPDMPPLSKPVLTMTLTNDGERPLRDLDVSVSAYTPEGLTPVPGQLIGPEAVLERPVPPGRSVTLHWRADLPLDTAPGQHLLHAQADYQTVDQQHGQASATAVTSVPPAVTATAEPSEIELSPGDQAAVTLHASSNVDAPLTIEYTTSTPSDSVSVEPHTAEFALPPGASSGTTLTLTLASSAEDPGSAAVELDLIASTQNGATTDVGKLGVDVQVLYASLQQAFNNVGITNDADPDKGMWGQHGRSYSAQALADAGITPGGTVTVDGIELAWPDVPAGTPDNVQANGQLITLTGTGNRLGFLGTSDGSEHQGTATIHYDDGTTSQFTLRFQHWAFPGREEDPVVTMPYINRSGVGREDRPVGLYFASAPVGPTKTATAVELPAISPPGAHGLHVFAMAIGP